MLRTGVFGMTTYFALRILFVSVTGAALLLAGRARPQRRNVREMPHECWSLNCSHASHRRAPVYAEDWDR